MITFDQFNEFVEKAHKNAVEHGFYDGAKLTNSAVQQRQMLIVCEVAEAMEADRKQRWLTQSKETFDELKAIVDGKECCSDFNKYYSLFIKGFAEEELADICIRCFDLFGFTKSKFHCFDLVHFVTTEKDIRIEQHTKAMPFWELCYTLTKTITPKNLVWIGIYKTVYYCFAWCDYNDIDLLTHIKAKMMYNTNRPYKHGKAY